MYSSTNPMLPRCSYRAQLGTGAYHRPVLTARDHSHDYGVALERYVGFEGNGCYGHGGGSSEAGDGKAIHQSQDGHELSSSYKCIHHLIPKLPLLVIYADGDKVIVDSLRRLRLFK